MSDRDFDGDGQSNFTEYVTGTFAGDATETFGLTIKEKPASQVRFEFYASTGKTYAIGSTGDMKTWTRVPFSVGNAMAGEPGYMATGSGIRSAFAAAGSGPKTFYRTITNDRTLRCGHYY